MYFPESGRAADRHRRKVCVHVCSECSTAAAPAPSYFFLSFFSLSTNTKRSTCNTFEKHTGRLPLAFCSGLHTLAYCEARSAAARVLYHSTTVHTHRGKKKKRERERRRRKRRRTRPREFSNASWALSSQIAPSTWSGVGYMCVYSETILFSLHILQTNIYGVYIQAVPRVWGSECQGMAKGGSPQQCRGLFMTALGCAYAVL